jgi:hypothetical protein
LARPLVRITNSRGSQISERERARSWVITGAIPKASRTIMMATRPPRAPSARVYVLVARSDSAPVAMAKTLKAHDPKSLEREASNTSEPHSSAIQRRCGSV